MSVPPNSMCREPTPTGADRHGMERMSDDLLINCKEAIFARNQSTNAREVRRRRTDRTSYSRLGVTSPHRSSWAKACRTT
jgi:hypothetical protein